MRIYRGFDEICSDRPRIATVGSFDGVHRGHQALLQKVKEEAQRAGAEGLVITFDPHPRLLLEEQSTLRLLSSTNEKIALLEQMGIDALLIIRFDHAFSRLKPEAFIRLLIEQAGVRGMVVGYDHRFGCDKSGNSDLLQRLGIRTIEVEEQQVVGEHLSSTAVRSFIQKGEMAHAAHLLGHAYPLSGHLQADGNFTLEEPKKLLPQSGRYTIKMGETRALLEIESERCRVIAPSIETGAKILYFTE
uniref:FAD synthetase n=1 Tax=Alistipes sp. TaxID=1872444 RepID=UPI0040577DC3